MKILILGGDGFLGYNLYQLFNDKFEVVYTTRRTQVLKNYERFFDFNNLSDSFLDFQEFDLIINCIALANIENCELDIKQANFLNYELPNFVSKLLKNQNVKFVQISTDNYFRNNRSKLIEGQKCTPKNIYAKTKLKAEKIVMRNNSNSIVIRSNFFGLDFKKRNSIVDWLLINLKQGKKIFGFTDYYFSPISVNFLGKAILELYANEFRGLIHIASHECISKYQFLVNVANVFGLDSTLILPSFLHKSNLLAVRPDFLCLDNSYFRSVLKCEVPSINEMIIDQFNHFKGTL